MTKPGIIVSFASSLLVVGAVSLEAGAAQPETPLGANRNKPERLEWLQDAGFGMFIHWSHDSQIGSVISHSMVGASEEYLEWFVNELPKTFNPKRWDADEIAALAKLCGMRYVVLTTKHHSGFCLWDTKTTDFNIMNTPYGKDVVADYVTALRRHGLAVGFYFSPEDFHWLHRNGHTVRRRGGDRPDADTHKEYGEFTRAQLTELFTDYGPVDVLFIDGEGEELTKQVAWDLQPNCLITRGAIETPEQYVPGRAPEGPWESCITMGTQWQYKPTNDEYKSGTRMIELLIETRAKGGALLLNVGPKPNGKLPKEQEERLQEIALWQVVNGESIRNTRPWTVTNEENIWFTKKKDENTVFAFLTRIPDWSRGERKEFVLRSTRATEETRISVLGHAGEVVEYNPAADPTPRFRQTDQGLELSAVRAQRLYNNHKWHNPLVVKIENVEPAFQRPPHVETLGGKSLGSGKVSYSGTLVDLAGADRVEVGFEYQVYGGFAAAMHNTQWSLSPMVTMNEPGDFKVEAEGLKPGETYQFRAIVKHPRITMRGDHKRVDVK